MFECLTVIEYFFKENVLKVLEDKKPSFKILMHIFKLLARMF
jgi:hypothetical protein